MSSDSYETRKQREFGGDVNESLKKTTIFSPKTLKMSESTFAAYTDCDDLIRPDMRRTSNYVGYIGMQQPGLPNFIERPSFDNLEQLYVCKIDKSILNGGRKNCSEEQPLDFSKKPIYSDRKNKFPHKFKKLTLNTAISSQDSQENSANSSDCVDESGDDEEETARFTVPSHANTTRVPTVGFHTNDSRNTILDERVEKLDRISGRKFLQGARKNRYKRNGLKADNSSGSEDEFHSEYSVQKSKSFVPNGDHSQQASSYNAHISEGKKSPYLQQTISDIPPVTNGLSGNGSNISTEKNDRFHIQDILSRDSQSALKEHSKTTHEINNSVTHQRTSSQSTFNNLVKEENPPLISTSQNNSANLPSGSTSPSCSINLHSASTSPSHSMNVPPESTSPSHSAAPFLPSRFQFGATDRLHEANGMISPYMHTVFPPNHIANFMNRNSAELPGYSRLYSYPPGTMLQPPFNPMCVQPYQQSILASQDQQRQKKQRPFKNIDPSVLMRHLPITQSAAILNLGPSPSSTYNSPTIKYPESSASAAMDSSPQRLSPDSPCIANGSSGNESMPQDTNDENGRKKIRRIPPEEKDEKYLEKRRKNNLAAKKSRDERRKKEDLLAVSCKELFEMKLKLETENMMLHESFATKERKLDMVIGNLISFREKCEGRTRDLFEETFRIFLPQQ